MEIANQHEVEIDLSEHLVQLADVSRLDVNPGEGVHVLKLTNKLFWVKRTGCPILCIETDTVEGGTGRRHGYVGHGSIHTL